MEEFLNDLVEVCRKHNKSLSHEDTHGAFQVVPFDEAYVRWLKEAYWSED